MTKSDGCQRPKAYWELPAVVRRTIDPRSVGGDEYFVMSKINHGLRLVAVDIRPPDDSRKPIEFEPGPNDPSDYSYYDPIASILYAGMRAGYDPEALMADAFNQVQTFERSAREEAAGRQRSVAGRRPATYRSGRCGLVQRRSGRSGRTEGCSRLPKRAH